MSRGHARVVGRKVSRSSRQRVSARAMLCAWHHPHCPSHPITVGQWAIQGLSLDHLGWSSTAGDGPESSKRQLSRRRNHCLHWVEDVAQVGSSSARCPGSLVPMRTEKMLQSCSWGSVHKHQPQQPMMAEPLISLSSSKVWLKPPKHPKLSTGLCNVPKPPSCCTP